MNTPRLKTIESFTVDHLRLVPGVYVSRKDRDDVSGAVVTTFDIRMRTPNKEPVMDTGAMHTLEHLLATYLRSSSWSSRCVYVGPMGCRTGFYLVFFGDLEPRDILELLRDAFNFVASFEGDIPGATPAECGNYHDQNLDEAHWEAKRFLAQVLDNPQPYQLVYPS